jgi:hypothetical protein
MIVASRNDGLKRYFKTEKDALHVLRGREERWKLENTDFIPTSNMVYVLDNGDEMMFFNDIPNVEGYTSEPVY